MPASSSTSAMVIQVCPGFGSELSKKGVWFTERPFEPEKWCRRFGLVCVNVLWKYWSPMVNVSASAW